MGNTHHTKKVQGAKSRPLWHFAIRQADKKKKAASKLEEESKWAVHYKPAQYEHQQENIFLPSSRPQHLEDLHKEAEIGLKSLQEQGNLDGYSQPNIRNGYGCDDEDSQHGEDVSLGGNSELSAPTDEVWAKTRSLPPPTPDEIRKDFLPSRSGSITTGTTFKPQQQQKIQSSFKGPKLKEKRIRRTTIMGLPQHVQQELGIGKTSHSNSGVKVPDADSAGVVSVSRADGNHCFNNVSHSRVRGSLRSVNFTDSSLETDESISTLEMNWGLINFSQRPKSLAVPKSSVPGELLQNPVMSMSPQATYLSKIIPNAILPAAVDVVMINTSQNCVRTLSRNSLIGAPSPACSRSISLQNYDGRDYASSDAWSHSQSSETIVSNNSTISSQGNAQPRSVEEDREKSRDQHNVTDSAPNPQANTSRWVNACPAQNVAAITEDVSAHYTSNYKTNELISNGYANRALSPAQSTGSIIDASDTQSITSERSLSRSLSVKKMKKPPAPPRRIHSLQQAEEQNSEFKDHSCASPGDDDVFSSSLGEMKTCESECARRSPVAAVKPPPNGLGEKTKGNILQSTKSSPPQNATSPNKSERTMSPSSGYSSQSGTPTLLRGLGSPSSPEGKSKPTESERSTSHDSSGRSRSTSLASISSSLSQHVDLFSIPPPPSSPAPLPPTVKMAKLAPSLLYAWKPATIPPPPTGPAPLPPTRKPSFLFAATTRSPPVTATAAPPPPITVASPTATPLPPVSVAPPPPITAAPPPPVTVAATPPVTMTPPAPAAPPLPVTAAVTPPVTMTPLVTAVPPPPVTVAPIPPVTATPPVTVAPTPPVTLTPPVTVAPTPPVTVALTPQVPTALPPPVSVAVTPLVTGALSVSEAPPPQITAAPALPVSTTTIPLVSVTPTRTVAIDPSAQAPAVTGNVVDPSPASALVAPHVPSTSVPTSASLTSPQLIPVAGKAPSPPPSPPPSHHPPPPKKATITGKFPPPFSPNISEAQKQEQSALDWPPPPPPLSPSVFTTSTETSSPSSSINVADSGQQDAEFLFPPPPPPLLTDTTQDKRLSAEGLQLVSPPAPPPLTAAMTLEDTSPGRTVTAASVSPPSPTSQLTETKMAKSTPRSTAPPTLNNPPHKAAVSGFQSADSQLSKVTQTSKVSNLDSEKELTVQSSSQDASAQDSKPIVTASLLQMVRLRSVQMTTYVPGESDNQQQANKNQLDLKPSAKSNVTAPSKPARKSLLRLSSSSDSESPLKPNNSLVVRKPTTLPSDVQGQMTLKPPDGGALLKSPASTASFIFSKNVSPKRLAFESPQSPAAEAAVKKSLMAELSTVSERIAAKTESKSPTNPPSKTVSETPAQRKPGRIPPPVAKKPLFLPHTHRLPSASADVRELPQAQGKSDTLGSTSDAKDEKGKLEKGNGQLALQEGN
ncbi:uncharacterized protein LOC144509453 isoform X2 [Mustelus asterias]